jgi:hypothetical protein
MKMIKLSEEHYIGVDESEIKEGDFVYSSDGGIFKRHIDNPCQTIFPISKITHSTQPIENLNGALGWKDIDILLLSEVKELLGVVDVENKAIEWYNGEPKYNSNYVADPYSWKEGYNQSLENNKERKYTEEDIRAVFIHGFLLGVDRGEYSIDMENKSLSKYLQLTEWEVEFIDGKLKLV